jgi:hypothetical protein
MTDGCGEGGMGVAVAGRDGCGGCGITGTCGGSGWILVLGGTSGEELTARGGWGGRSRPRESRVDMQKSLGRTPKSDNV